MGLRARLHEELRNVLLALFADFTGFFVNPPYGALGSCLREAAIVRTRDRGSVTMVQQGLPVAVEWLVARGQD